MVSSRMFLFSPSPCPAMLKCGYESPPPRRVRTEKGAIRVSSSLCAKLHGRHSRTFFVNFSAWRALFLPQPRCGRRQRRSLTSFDYCFTSLEKKHFVPCGQHWLCMHICVKGNDIFQKNGYSLCSRFSLSFQGAKRNMIPLSQALKSSYLWVFLL